MGGIRGCSKENWTRDVSQVVLKMSIASPILADIAPRDRVLDAAMTLEQERAQKSARRKALLVALLVHVIVGLLATLAVVVVGQKSGAPVIQAVSAPEASASEEATKVFKTNPVVETTRAAAVAPNVFTAAAVSPIAMPDMDESLSEPDMGFGSADLGIGFENVGMSAGGAASFFGIEAPVKSVVLVIDTSSSMPKQCGPQGIAAIRKEIKRVLDSLSPDARFNIICYGNDADRFSQRLVDATPAERKAANRFMAGYFGAGPWLRTRVGEYGRKNRDPQGIKYYPITPDDIRELNNTSGGSRIELGLLAAFEMKPETIFVLSDGAPSVKRGKKRLNHDALLKLIDQAAEKEFKGSTPRPQINTVSINGLGQDFLTKIAKTFDGKHRDIRPKTL